MRQANYMTDYDCNKETIVTRCSSAVRNEHRIENNNNTSVSTLPEVYLMLLGTNC